MVNYKNEDLLLMLKYKFVEYLSDCVSIDYLFDNKRNIDCISYF